MKRAKTYYAERNGFRMEGSSKSEAKANLDSALDWICGQGFPVVETRFGLVLIITPTIYGFETRVIDSVSEHGKRFDSSCCYGRIPYTEALEHVRNHAAQMAWTPAIADDYEFVAMAGLTPYQERDLARWIRFQRSYIELKAAGHTPNDCHRLACEASYN